MASKHVKLTAKTILAVPKSTLQDVYDIMYPVGSHHIGFEAPIVPVDVSASWSVDTSYNNKALWVDSTMTPGTTITGSLPDIGGNLSSISDEVGFSDAGATGAFYQQVSSSLKPVMPKSTTTTTSQVGFQASRSNSVYRAEAGSDVVRPTSVAVTVWKREA